MNNEFQKTHIKIKNCLACDGSNLRTILDLGKQPLANNYHNGCDLIKFPLKLNLCTDCYHLQLSHAVNPDLMFKNYLYVSGTTDTLKNYFDYFSKKTLEFHKTAKSVLDIACNDGTQLDSYKKLGLKTYGIDPAINLYDICSSKGHEVICDYFNLNTVHKFNNNKFDIILAQNVFAHTKYTVSFLESCKKIMNDDSILFVQTSQSNMIVNNEFDTIYHEHISFFNTNSMKQLVQRSGLVLNNVFKTDIHGTSYVFVITKTNINIDKNIDDIINTEQNLGLFDIQTYLKYSLNCYDIAFKLKTILNEFKLKQYKIIGYGAAAKGNTLLNFANIKLDLIIDDNPLKQNLYTPGMNIPIVHSDILLNYNDDDNIIFVPLAWNFYNEIRQKIKTKRNNNNDLFVKYFPNLTVEK